jgi:hypothetical protein
MSTATPPVPARPRHALGLPAGSIRALLAFLVLGVLWLLAWKTEGDKLPLSWVYLQYVMILIIAHYFASHGSTIAGGDSTRSPLGLPSGSVRLLLLLGYGGLVVWLLYNRREFEIKEPAPLLLPAILLGAFFLGYLVNRGVRGVSGGRAPYWYQDMEAWIALLATIGMAVIVIIRVFIDPGLLPEERFPLTTLETIVAGIVGFYFGARS